MRKLSFILMALLLSACASQDYYSSYDDYGYEYSDHYYPSYQFSYSSRYNPWVDRPIWTFDSYYYPAYAYGSFSYGVSYVYHDPFYNPYYYNPVRFQSLHFSPVYHYAYRPSHRVYHRPYRDYLSRTSYHRSRDYASRTYVRNHNEHYYNSRQTRRAEHESARLSRDYRMPEAAQRRSYRSNSEQVPIIGQPLRQNSHNASRRDNRNDTAGSSYRNPIRSNRITEPSRSYSTSPRTIRRTESNRYESNSAANEISRQQSSTRSSRNYPARSKPVQAIRHEPNRSQSYSTQAVIPQRNDRVARPEKPVRPTSQPVQIRQQRSSSKPSSSNPSPANRSYAPETQPSYSSERAYNDIDQKTSRPNDSFSRQRSLPQPARRERSSRRDN